MSQQSKTSASGFLISMGAVLLSILCYYADTNNVPVIAPCVDCIAAPGLRLVPDTQPPSVSNTDVSGCCYARLIFFLVSTLIAACFDKPPSANDRIEVQLQKHGADRKKRRLDDDGFTIH
jgi:hypothetical protein